MAKRVFAKTTAKKKAKDYHGGARYERSLPDISVAPAISHGVKSVNLEFTFEEALKLSLAVSSCLLELNRYHRGTIEGRDMGMLLSIKTDNSSITVIQKKIRSTS